MARTTTEATSEVEQATSMFIEGPNNDDWETVRLVVAPGHVFHHPLGRTAAAGPEGMQSWTITPQMDGHDTH